VWWHRISKHGSGKQKGQSNKAVRPGLWPNSNAKGNQKVKAALKWFTARLTRIDN
jgi:hypothetical protein